MKTDEQKLETNHDNPLNKEEQNSSTARNRLTNEITLPRPHSSPDNSSSTTPCEAVTHLDRGTVAAGQRLGRGPTMLAIEAGGRNHRTRRRINPTPPIRSSSIPNPHGPCNQRSPGFLKPRNCQRTGPSERLSGRPDCHIPCAQVPDHGVVAAATWRRR